MSKSKKKGVKPVKKKAAKSPAKKKTSALTTYVPPSIPVVAVPECIKLTFETIPGSLHGRSLKNLLPSNVWDIIRRKCYQAAGYKCEICGGTGIDQGRRWPVECHEKWEYDDIGLVQRLVGFIALCPRCHLCKHPGYAGIKGLREEMWMHFYNINGPRTAEMDQYLTDEARLFHARSLNKGWQWDVSYASEYAGVPVVPKEFDQPNYRERLK